MMTILIADDHEDIRQLVALQLRQRGFDVVVASNGREALKVAAEAVPQLILMDLNMPEVDGWEAVCKLRAEPRLSHIPIIALTAYVLPGDQARAKSAGCNACQAKPIDFELLHQEIQALLASA